MRDDVRVTAERPAIDHAAVAALRDEPLPWSTKGWPLTDKTRSPAGLAAGGPRLDEAGFSFPLMTLTEADLTTNIEALAAFSSARGVALAPHGKTTMAPQLFERQLAAGAWGITAATIDHVLVYRRFGVRGILLANELVDPPALGWILDEQAADPGFELLFYLDSMAGVAAAAEALAAQPRPGGPLQALIEIGVGGGRTGCRSIPEAVAVARAAVAVPGLEVVGIAGYEGLFGYDGDSGAVASARAYLATLRDALREFVAAGLLRSTKEAILTAAGSGYFDVVVDELHDAWPADERPTVIIRPGSYIGHAERDGDDGPLQRAGFPMRLLPAMLIWARILSRPEPGQAFASAGRRDLSWDVSEPVPRWVWRRGAEQPVPADGLTVAKLNDQHAFIELPDAVALEPGDLVAFGTTHPCTTFDRWAAIAVIDDDFRVVDAIRTFF
jgi:D-serine deaminase-like pyridoxal phosphate-dependent protein